MASVVEDYGPRLNVTIWSLTNVALLFLGIRIALKVWRGRPVRWEDWVLVAAWSTLATSCSLLSAITRLGYGRHNVDIAPQHFNHILLVSYVAGFFSILAACWSKISFAITLLRIATVTQTRVKVLLWTIIVSVNLVLGTSATLHFAQCWPPERLWKAHSVGSCLPRYVVIDYNIFVASFSGFIDIVLAVMPWFIVWDASISKKEKISALVATSMGVFAGITSFLKIKSIGAIGSKDLVDSVSLLIFGIAESAVTIIAVSIPVLRALLHIKTTPPKPRFYQVPYEERASESNRNDSSAHGESDIELMPVAHQNNDRFSVATYYGIALMGPAPRTMRGRPYGRRPRGLVV